MSISTALQIAENAKDPVRNFRLSAVICKGNKVIATGTGQRKTHPKQAAFAKLAGSPDKICLHAEIDALIKACKWSDKTKKSLNGCTIFVARVKKDGTPGLAKPCNVCSMVLKKFGIRVVYTK